MSDEHLSKVILKVLAKFAENLGEARDRVDPDSERRLAVATVAECMSSALLDYDAAPTKPAEASPPARCEMHGHIFDHSGGCVFCGALRHTHMTPYQKAIEAAIESVHCRKYGVRFGLEDEVRDGIRAFLASARESGWEMKPREPIEAMFQAYDECARAAAQEWQAMFAAAPRFEDAP